MMNEDTTSNTSSSPSSGLLGDFLKQKRLDKNYSLEKLSQKTKISVNILKSLEANDYEHLPSAAYIKGFVSSYAKVLGLSSEETISKMEYTYLNILGKPFPALNHTKSMALANAAKSNQPLPLAEPSPHEVIASSDSIMENTKSALPIVILASVILVFIGGYKLISSVVENEVTGNKNSNLGPKIESSSALVKHPNLPKPVEKTETSATTDKPADAAATVEAPKEEVKPVVELERNFPTIDFKKVKGKLFQVRTDAPENEDETLLPETIKNAINSKLQNIYIKAFSGNTWVSYKIDSSPIESVIINKGSDLFLQGSEIRLFLGNVNVTKIFYNNYLIETPTKSGVKSLIFPEESNSKYLMPLFPKAKDDILYTAEDYTKRMNLEVEELKKRKQE
ncbi:MAG: helix-turn-helix domain-containing protein [Bdellovibrionales bacterium]|nr:helix-turn-helix domain-containing protein [Bdellovibrionales bacterium]